MGEDAGPGAVGMAVQVHRDVDLARAQPLRHLRIALAAHIVETVEGLLQPRPHRRCRRRDRRRWR